jgi:vitamin B12/bleomycin/antimicrobial peptide transport system ATP-binding/permease protein
MNGFTTPQEQIYSPADTGVVEEVHSLWKGVGASLERRRMVLFIAAIIIIVCLNAFGQINLNAWQGPFYDAVDRRDYDNFIRELFVFMRIVVGLLILVVTQTWFVELIKLDVRNILTRHLIDEWLKPRRAYRLQFIGESGEHPDQRVHEDARHLAELTAELGVGLMQSTLLLLSFVGALWILSDGMAVFIENRPIIIPGYMVWCALAYAFAGSWLTWRVGRPLITLNVVRYQREATLRFALVRIDESAQSIALYGGEKDERKSAGEWLSDALSVGRQLANSIARLTWITSAYGWGTIVVPVIAASPAYFTGTLSLGGLMMVVGAFNQVQSALRWYVDNFSRIADWRATLRRVYVMRQVLMLVDDEHNHSQIEIHEDPSDGIIIDQLRINLPIGEVALDEPHIHIAPGEHILLTGEAEHWKTTVFLTIAGLWTIGSGKITMPAREHIMFMPQHPYLPFSTLREAIAYPASPTNIADTDMRTVLIRLGFGYLVSDLDRKTRWDRDLTLEEQQGIAWARLLLRRPLWVFMDDAASAFDETRRKALFALLAHELPTSTIIGTSRSDALDGFWTRVLRISCVNCVLPSPVFSMQQKRKSRKSSLHDALVQHNRSA